MSDGYSRFTVKDLVEYCSRLCAEGHGTAPVQIQFGDARVREADVEGVELQDDKLMVMMEDELSWHLSDTPPALIEEIVSHHDRDVEIEDRIAKTYLEVGMDVEDKQRLIKQWINELL